MDIFSKNKFLQRIVIILILLNIITISLVLWQNRNGSNNPKPKRNPEKAVSVLTDKLQLDSKQKDNLLKIRDDFYQKEEVLSTLIKAQRDSMNLEIFNENTDSACVNHLAKKIADNEYQMELYRIDQAQQLKNICNKEQLVKFKDLVLEIRDFFQPKKKRD
jgi:Spy/CpxP family protein refolding chaperone